MRRRLPLSLLLLLGASPAAAFRAPPGALSDAQRFGLDRPEAPAPPRRRRYAPQSVVRLQQLARRGASIRYSPRGVAAVMGVAIPTRGGSPEAAARGFLSDYREALEIDPQDLRLRQSRATPEGTHLLFEQTHLGLPVEFARVKLHLDASGNVIALHSSRQPDIEASPVPEVSMERAAQAVAAEVGGSVPGRGGPDPGRGGPDPGRGALVYLPSPKTGEVRLAWRFEARGAGASWRVYVDARTGEVLLRYSALRFAACPGGTSGTVTGSVFDVDPSSTPAVSRPIANEKVWEYSAQITTYVVTGADGSFCNPGTPGKIVTALQGPYARVGHFSLDALEYDNGGGTWVAAATPLSSPSPYPDSPVYPASPVFSGLLNSPVPNAVGMRARFDFFSVGSQDAGGDISDDDEVHVYDWENTRVASYVGSKSLPFLSAPTFGCFSCAQAPAVPAMRLELRANQAGQGLGFRVNVSSFLVLSDNPTAPANPSNVVWLATMTADHTDDEINVFYHLNRMHDYFIGGVDSSSGAWISSGVVAMVHFGPNLGNAFFDPDHDNLAFGDLVAGIALDATVIHHEYTHFVVDKIFPIINFGQDGAASEGLADYFSASSLNDPHIGRYVSSSLSGSEAALRDLACSAGGPRCAIFPNDWTGEIHQDSLAFSQALWEIRSDLVGALGSTAGQACADGLVFRSLFFFPDGFQEFLDSMLLVDAAGTVPACGGTRRGTILTRFGNHGIGAPGPGPLYAYEPNDGTQSAVDISTLGTITAALYPESDLDYYSFSAGPGHIHAALQLPRASAASYFAYGLTLIDGHDRSLESQFPPINVNPTLNGGCPISNCQTTAAQVALDYDSSSPGQYYLLVSAAPTDAGSNSGTNSTVPYTLVLQSPLAGALSGGIVNAHLDNDLISFTVVVGSFNARPNGQNFQFAYAQLRDHRLQVIPNTAADGVTPSFLALQPGASSAGGLIQGAVQLRTLGGQSFSQRYPSLGTVYLEVFARDALQGAASAQPGAAAANGTPQSLGLSNAINLTASGVGLTAYNNLFNPSKGQMATVQYAVAGGGHVRLQLFTRAGALVKTLFDGEVLGGKGSVDWSGRNSAGQAVASGLYLLRLEGPGGAQATQKVVVVK